ncbi:MAG: ABC transporter permease [Anaerolineae bacterium]|nr:ABC transporter permease [Anaerolineae bacterium]
MTKYIIRRLILGIPVLFLTILVTFMLIRLVPGGPFDNYGAKSPPPELKAALEARYGLNKPLFFNMPNDGKLPDDGKENRVIYERLPSCDLLQQGKSLTEAIPKDSADVYQGWSLLYLAKEHRSVTVNINNRPTVCNDTRYVLYSDLTRSQFFEYINNVLRLDFGPSLGKNTQGRPVWDIIREKIPVSFQLNILSEILAFAIGIPMGVLAAVKRNTIIDYATTFFAVLLASIPSYVLGPMLLLIFVTTWHIVPAPNPIAWKNPNYLSWEFWGRALLPLLALGIGGSAGTARLMRASVLEVLQDEYIRTARAKGLRERTVLYLHALKNALIPIATSIGPLLAGLLGGSLFIEAVFAIPGMGDSFLAAIGDRDYNMLVGISLLFSLFLILGNILVDVIYTWLDPRIRFS